MANTQNTVALYDNFLGVSTGAPKTAQDVQNMIANVQADTSLDPADKAQLLQDLQSLKSVVGNDGSYQAASVVGGSQNVRSQVVASATPAPTSTTAVNVSLVVEPEAEAQASTLTSNSQGSQILSLMQQDPDVLSSLKQYVKSEASQSLLDAVMNAMNTTGSYGSNSQPKNSKAVASPQAVAGGASGQAAGSAGNGLTFTAGAATTADETQLPTVDSGIQLTSGGAQSGNGNTASLDGWDANLGLSNPGNIDEFLMMVLLASYEDGQKGLEQMAQELQKTNDQKKALRSQLAGLYNEKTGNENSDTGVDAQIENVQGQLSSASDDAQMQQLQLQNATQNQQELLQEISSFSKDLYDASMNILRKIGS
jgi:hypothetical protein